MIIFKSIDPLVPVVRGGWLGRVSGEIREQFEAQYRKGQESHGCDLGTVDTRGVFAELEREAFDTLAYVQELKRRCQGEVIRGLTADDQRNASDAIELLRWVRQWVPHKRSAADIIIKKLEDICRQ